MIIYQKIVEELIRRDWRSIRGIVHTLSETYWHKDNKDLKRVKSELDDIVRKLTREAEERQEKGILELVDKLEVLREPKATMYKRIWSVGPHGQHIEIVHHPNYIPPYNRIIDMTRPYPVEFIPKCIDKYVDGVVEMLEEMDRVAVEGPQRELDLS